MHSLGRMHLFMCSKLTQPSRSTKIKMLNGIGGGGGARGDTPVAGQGAGNGNHLGGACSVLVGRSGGITKKDINIYARNESTR